MLANRVEPYEGKHMRWSVLRRPLKSIPKFEDCLRINIGSADTVNHRSYGIICIQFKMRQVVAVQVLYQSFQQMSKRHPSCPGEANPGSVVCINLILLLV